MSREARREKRNDPHPDTPHVRAHFGQPDSCEALIDRYGTYNIQPTADTENRFPMIAHGLPKAWKNMAVGRDDLERQ